MEAWHNEPRSIAASGRGLDRQSLSEGYYLAVVASHVAHPPAHAYPVSLGEGSQPQRCFHVHVGRTSAHVDKLPLHPKKRNHYSPNNKWFGDSWIRMAPIIYNAAPAAMAAEKTTAQSISGQFICRTGSRSRPPGLAALFPSHKPQCRMKVPPLRGSIRFEANAAETHRALLDCHVHGLGLFTQGRQVVRFVPG